MHCDRCTPVRCRRRALSAGEGGVVCGGVSGAQGTLRSAAVARVAAVRSPGGALAEGPFGRSCGCRRREQSCDRLDAPGAPRRLWTGLGWRGGVGWSCQAHLERCRGVSGSVVASCCGGWRNLRRRANMGNASTVTAMCEESWQERYPATWNVCALRTHVEKCTPKASTERERSSNHVWKLNCVYILISTKASTVATKSGSVRYERH